MRQKELYKTLDNVASEQFASVKDMIIEVLHKIIEDKSINVNGGRVWKLEKARLGYNLLYQTGNIQPIEENFTLLLDKYPIFERLSFERTILAEETDEVLISKGIKLYSASGVGPKIKIDGKKYYEYLFALNSDQKDEELLYTLNIVATLLTSKIRERSLHQSRKDLIEGIDKAREIQKRILPEHELNYHNYQVFGVTVPSEILGGDFFDYLPIGHDEERIGIVVGDAASHGFGAAAEAMYISGAVRMASNFEIKMASMMSRLNNLINKIFSDDKFTTMFYGELSNDKKGLFLYCNAGHNQPLFYKAADKQISYLEVTGPLLGPAPNSRYTTDSINFDEDDLLVIISDGIVEAANKDFDFYGEERLENIIKENCNLEPRELTTKILDDVLQFSGSARTNNDDKTVVVIKRKS
jgi:sigma-B regulation protein RsbU (phosphoserine phosphatase)